MRGRPLRTQIPQTLTLNQQEQERIALDQDKDAISPTVYKGTQTINGVERHLVREELVDYYDGKCAYCESIENKPEVEHYRPKKRVSEDDTHPGYYWVCYEWTNLLPSCRYCKTEGGKGNKFPIKGTRVSSPPLTNNQLDFNSCIVNSNDLLGEKAKLIHPEIDEPENCLRFNRAGKIFGKGGSGKGSATVDICNLNRDNLKVHRKRLVDDFVERVRDSFVVYFNNHRNIQVLKSSLEAVFKRLDQRCAIDEPFSLVAINIRDKFDTFITRQLDTSIQQDFASTIYQEYRQSNPF